MRALLNSVLMSIILVGCSTTLQQSIKSKKISFEQAFAEQCVKKEIAGSLNSDVDAQRFSKPCLCIAKSIAANASEQEMDRFLYQKKMTRAMSMRFDKAAYFCVQKATTPQSKLLFEKTKM